MYPLFTAGSCAAIQFASKMTPRDPWIKDLALRLVLSGGGRNIRA